MGQHRHHVRTNKRRIGRATDDQRTTGPGCDQHAGLPLRNHRDGITSANLFRRRAHRIRQMQFAFLHVHIDQVRDDFRVGFGLKLVAVFDQALLQLDVIFDDSVVHQDTTLGAVRVGVLLGGLAVRRPTRVPDAAHPADGLLLQRLLQIDQLADAAANLDLLPALNRHAGRVVPAIFQLRQPVQQNWYCVLISHVANDATHRSPLPPFCTLNCRLLLLHGTRCGCCCLCSLRTLHSLCGLHRDCALHRWSRRRDLPAL